MGFTAVVGPHFNMGSGMSRYILVVYQKPTDIYSGMECLNFQRLKLGVRHLFRVDATARKGDEFFPSARFI